jgi:hypothetical protein
VPVSFPPEPFGPVPLHRVPEFPWKGKTNTVIIKAVAQNKELCAGTSPAFSPFEYLLNRFPLFQMLNAPETKNAPFANKASFRRKSSALTGPWPCGASKPAALPGFSSGRETRICGSASLCSVDMSVSWDQLLYIKVHENKLIDD